ncbi:G-type lectin S-receptor-like serine/threonine-protein kinase LECRK3 [Oryza brachyantha]|uniref:G-type lectin S-receptor-like serine/threonine-protein kinase LECRK3 n=1 Tax=Oryza brachyantha TaxID=4533 RepID=UPI001ADC0F29|nr:G-type lectin S-receptor-like serine/threonine-protein kinase LECRK3 [Oryza brachyantha]
MRDDGNFVLYAANATVVWTTFAAPTDTLLAGQDLVPGAQLFSSVAATSRATGKYRLTNQLNDGNLVMYPVSTMNVAAAAYWDTGTFQIGFPLTLRLDASGVLYLVGNNGSYTKNLTQPSAAQAGEKAHYHRVTLDPDGVLRSYRHGLLSSGAWKTDVEWIGPSDRCHVKGACGFNSYCVLDRDGQPSCLCPPGFDLIDAGDASRGCTASSGAGECTAGQRDGPGFSMAAMQNVSWADTPYGVLAAGTSAADCQAACMSDCFCAAALLDSNDGTCTKQQLPLRYGRAGGGYTLFVKTGGVASPGLGGGGGGGGNHRHRVRRVSTVALVCVGVLTFVALCALVASARLLWLNQRMVRRHVALADAVAAEVLDEEAPLRSYSYEELEHATYSFRDPLGRGAFGTVFKGTLQHGGERAIAVKRLEKLVEDGEREFQREVRAIGRTSHRNLVRLLGFCHEGANRLLVYEYMSNGSLADLLFKGGGGATCPAWHDRVSVALDVARGLHYLHDELDSRVIHCDVKPQNILMDAAGTAKISDFGLAKLLRPDQTRTFTGVRGTRGYLAPEWYRGAGPVTVKADVYSYGVVLLEIVTCRRSMEMEEAGEERTLMEWAYEWLAKGEVKGAMRSDEAVEAAEEERVVKVAMWCVQAEPQSRPSMESVILMLQGLLEVPFPPPPASS